MDIEGFVNGFIVLQSDMATRTTDCKEEYAQRFGGLLENLLTSCRVKPGIPVSTTGSATAQSGTTTAHGELI